MMDLERGQAGVVMAGPRHMGAPGWPLFWRLGKASNSAPVHSDILQTVFGLGQGWRTFLCARAKISHNFRKNSFSYGKPKFTTPYFKLFQ
jgi:hypothetical protein